jgi:hypothetical protein
MPKEEDRLVAMIDAGLCPDCRYRGFVLGPRGGMSINIECGNVRCRARFNVASGFGSHHILMAQRLSKQSEGGADWSD